MSIKDRNLTTGNQVNREVSQTAVHLPGSARGSRQTEVRLADGREFKSPSAAGMAITGHACDGWMFWSVATAEAAPNPQTPEAANQGPATDANARRRTGRNAPMRKPRLARPSCALPIRRERRKARLAGIVPNAERAS